MSNFRTKVKRTVDTAKCWLDVDRGLVQSCHHARQSNEYQAVYSKSKPLVSVCVTTYNRGELLVERCLPSILGQTYANLEVIVVGDCCTDDTAKLIEKINDRRLCFVNLPTRGDYPKNPRLRWMVAGTQSINHALQLSTGDFITHLDDDDAYAPDRIEKLVEFTQSNRLDFVWHPFHMQAPDLSWYIRECAEFQKGSVTTSSSFYHAWFKRIGWNPKAYRFYEPGDWNRFRKFRYIGVEAAHYPEPLLWHYRERSQ